MGRTLFWYLFRDLVRIFLLAAVVLAAIMSLGGLLRPLTRFGLDAGQVMQMWLYLMPAMMTYSMPVAAVFATSMVYGRLTADNELTACRAAGISYRSVLAPAVGMGILASVISLVFLSFVVPYFFLQGERVIYTNVAKYIASDIERRHEFSMGRGKPAIFAQEAYIPPESGKNGEQVAVLKRPMIVSYPKSGEHVPKTFAMAEQVTLYIRHGEDNAVEVSGVLKGVTQFHRVMGSRPEVGIGQTEFGPITLPALMTQQVKFMNVLQLKDLAIAPEGTSRVKEAIKSFIESEQQQAFYRSITDALAAARGTGFVSDRFTLSAPGAKSSLTGKQGDHLLVEAGDKPLVVTIRQPGLPSRVYEARKLEIFADMDNANSEVQVTFELSDVAIRVGTDLIQKALDTQYYTVAMSDELRDMKSRKVTDYLKEEGVPAEQAKLRLARQRMIAVNEVVTEMHSRASYGLSCLVLVLVGAVLGMQFKSGDFLTAFSVSVLPALLTITLVVSGAQSATDVPNTLRNPLAFGLVLIWIGNAIAAGLVVWLFKRIQRT